MIIALQTLIYFRKALLSALERLIRPYYKNIFLTFNGNGNTSDDEVSDEDVFAEFDEEKGVVFFPPMYCQRYAAVTDCLMDDRWCGKLEKVVDLGYHDISFIKYLKDVPGIKHILGVDLESIPLRCSSDLLDCDNQIIKKENTQNTLQVTLFQGNAADPDYRLIGCDAVIAIEMIEHMLPHDLERLIHTVFGFIKPWVAIFTTPNGEFNVLFKALEKNGLRRLDHFFEWTRGQFNDWCSNIVARYPEYTVSCRGIGPGPSGTEHCGCCSQLALFVSKDYHKQQDLNIDSLALVANAAKPKDKLLKDMINDWDVPDENETSSLTELNCTTHQVKKYSKATQHLMARNNVNSFSNTREVVDEICHLIDTLNFNKGSRQKLEEEGTNQWHNFNWGDNAPYWNEYYKVVREYGPSLQVKSDETRILDAVSEEINKIVDVQFDEDFSVDSKFEIPLQHLLKVVQQITDDVDKVKDILEWNGYEVIDDFVVHSRVDSSSMVAIEDNWKETNTNVKKL